jgi:hypothetical protein
MIESSVPFADIALARRLERAEATSNARAVEARARLRPESGAAWIEVAGAFAMFDSPASPMTQTFGLGIFQPPTIAELEAIESFYATRGAPVHHEISPLADPALVRMLCERGYQPFEFTSVMYRPIGGTGAPAASAEATAGRVDVRLIGETEAEVFARTAAEGWRESGHGDFI